MIGFGLVILAPSSGSDTSPTQRNEHLSIPLATPIELSAEWVRRLGLTGEFTGQLAMASDHQILSATSHNTLSPSDETRESAGGRVPDATKDSPDSAPSDQLVNPESDPGPSATPDGETIFTTAGDVPREEAGHGAGVPQVSEPTQTSGNAMRPDSLPESGGDLQKEFRLQVRLHDGSIAAARIVAKRSGVALIELDQPSGAHGRKLATLTPVDNEHVVLLTDQPQTMTYAQLIGLNQRDALGLVGGAAVVTAEGHLLGICVEHSDGLHTRFISVDELFSAATSPAAKHP
jgi:hypothetical protein